MLGVPFDMVAAGVMLIIGILVLRIPDELDGFNDPTPRPIPGSVCTITLVSTQHQVGIINIW